MDKLIVIDGNSLINRAFYALPLLTTKNGQHTNAVYGFCNILVKIINETNPSHLIVAFDMGKPTFRHILYADYKGTRHKMPEELAEQLPLLQSVLTAMGIKILQKEGIEADDIIGTIAKRFDCPTIIVTGDKDCLQLVDNSTEVWLTKKGISNIVNLNMQNFKQEMGIVPSQIIDLKAMMGDASDNIPGIPGVGEKTAFELLNQFETVDNLYNNVNDLSGSRAKKIIEGKNLAFLSKTLATIKTDCDIKCTLDEAKLKIPFTLNVKKMFIDLEFSSLARRDNLFADEEQQLTFDDMSMKETNNTELASIEDVKQLLNNEKFSKIAIIKNNDKIEFAFDDKNNYSCDINFSNCFDNIMSDKNIYKVFYNIKQTHRNLFSNQKILGSAFDVLIALNLLEGQSKDIKKIDTNLERFNSLYGYATALIKAESVLKDELEKEKLFKLYTEMELPLENILFEMEKYGIKVDKSILKELTNSYKNEIKQIEMEIYELAGEKFNINSTKQLASILFDKLQIKTVNNKKRSTSFDVLERIEESHPILPFIMRYRKVGKLLSTYLEGFVKYIDKDDLIHTEFEQTMASTGRLSSNNPNLQNIPIKDEDGRILRKMFVPKNPNNYFIGADYNQVELRLLAHFSQDPTLLDAFLNGEDVHKSTASWIFDAPIENVSNEMRQIAKTVNFGIIYGISDYGLSQTLKIPPKIAKLYIEKYFDTFKQVKTYMNECVEKAKKDGYAITLLGRKRKIPELFSSNKIVQKFGERVAMNMPLQGTGCEIIKLAMIQTQNKINELNLKSHLVLQIHDELIVECPENEVEIMKGIIKDSMENIIKLTVPLPVSINVGKSLYEI